MSIEHIRAIKAAAGLPKPKKYKPIAKKSAKKLKQEAEERDIIKESVELGKSTGIPDQEQWFEDRMKESLPVCMNCGMEANWLLQPEYKKIWRACQAHILPKRKTQFPSVATHPMNHLVLFPVWGGHLCGCHNEFDSSWFNATTMKVWGIAIHRFKEFESAIAPKERYRIPEQFLK
jgi:hypothetical protein